MSRKHLRPHKAVSPILLGEVSIIQPALNMGQEEVRRECPPMPQVTLSCQEDAVDVVVNCDDSVL